jgi:hypothetical protein
VLLEMSLTTSDAVGDVARRAAERGDSIDDIVLQAFTEMARRTERLPRAAIARTIREFYKYPTRARELSMTRRVWPQLLGEAQERGELPGDLDPADLSDMMNALMITAVEGWVHNAHDALAPELAYRMRVLLAGVRAAHGG